MTISTIFVIKNGINLGYCFWESLQSCIPFSDEIIISDGYSKDDTYKYLLRFSQQCQHDVSLYRDEWDENSYVGEAISRVTEKVMKRANCDWIYLLQADEIIHEDLAHYIKEFSNNDQYGSISFPFYHFIREWQPCKNPAYTKAIRMVRKSRCPSLKGDAWTFRDIDPVCPAEAMPKPIYHFAWCFPKTNDLKDISHAQIYQNVTEYQSKMRAALKSQLASKSIEHHYKIPYPRTDFDDFPILARRFVGEAEYSLPDIL